MTLKDQMALDMQNTFLNTDEFAEDIVYTPKCGTAKTIPAVVDRGPVSPSGENQARSSRKSAEILIHNDADNGVTTVNDKGDKVTFKRHPDEDAIEWDVVAILESSESHWLLKVEP